MDQNQWFNSGSPAPTLDRQAFEAGWTAAQRQIAFTPQTPRINERIFQQQPQTGHSFLMNWSDWLCEECLL